MPLAVCVERRRIRQDLAPHPQARAARDDLNRAADLFRRFRLGPALDSVLESDHLLSRVLYPED
jgi:hypothetical protein